MNEVQFGMNEYCGPAVLSIFTGANTDQCAAEITKVNGKHSITGVQPSDLIKAGQTMGLEFKENEAFIGRSLFWTASALVNFPGTYLITIPRHYISIQVESDRTILICDNHTKTPMDLQNSSRLSQKVERVWKVTKVFDWLPPEIQSEIIEVQILSSTVTIKNIIQYTDGGIKVRPLGSIFTTDTTMLKIITDKLFNLIEEKE